MNNKKQIEKSYFSLQDDTTSRLSMFLEIVIGMPVSITKNITDIGVSNGSLGYVVDIKFEDNTFFKETTTANGVQIKYANKLPKYVFVKLMQPGKHAIGNLDIGIVPMMVFKQQVKFKFRNFSKAISQIPIIPAFSTTTDRSQGLTLESSLIGNQINLLRKHPPFQILYVAFSRVRDPRNIRIEEKMTLEYIGRFKPPPSLAKIEEYLKNRECNEFF
jgi:hypothetical protein